MRIQRWVYAALACGIAASSVSAFAQSAAKGSSAAYPTKPVRMVVPFSPGGTSDTLSRILGQKMTEAWGQQVVIDGRPGASGIIGTEIAARAPADGYTLLHANLSLFATNPSLHSRLSYETFRDFTPLTLVATAPQLIVVNPALPAKSVQELIQLARAKPGALNFGSGGTGVLSGLAGEMFKTMAGVAIVHISYKGTVLAISDLLGGQVQIVFSDMPIALPHTKSGKLRALAVTGPQRSVLAPGFPTVVESGLPGYVLENWWGVLAPSKVPQPIIDKLSAEIVRIHLLPEIKERYVGVGVESTTSTPAQFADYIKSEAAKFAKIIKDAGVQVQ